MKRWQASSRHQNDANLLIDKNWLENQSISVMKALKLASEQRQNIYQINSKDINAVLPQLSHDAKVISDIGNAVTSGKVVTTSEKSINLNSRKDNDYMIIDPNTGNEAYMISGCLNGGEFHQWVISYRNGNTYRSYARVNANIGIWCISIFSYYDL